MNSGRREDFWGLTEKFGDNPGDSKIPLDLRLSHSRRYATYRGAHANRNWMTGSSEQRLRAERRGKRLWFTRRRRLRRGEKPRSEATSTGQPGRRAEEHAAKRRAPGNRGGERRSSFGAPSRRLAGGHGQRGTGRSRGAPQLHPRNHSVGGVIERWHGQPGQRERRQDTGPGNRSRVQLRERRSVRRQDRLEGAPLPGNRWWRHRLRSRATGNRGQHGHRPPSLRARRAMCRSSEG